MGCWLTHNWDYFNKQEWFVVKNPEEKENAYSQRKCLDCGKHEYLIKYSNRTNQIWGTIREYAEYKCSDVNGNFNNEEVEKYIEKLQEVKK